MLYIKKIFIINIFFIFIISYSSDTKKKTDFINKITNFEIDDLFNKNKIYSQRSYPTIDDLKNNYEIMKKNLIYYMPLIEELSAHSHSEKEVMEAATKFLKNQFENNIVTKDTTLEKTPRISLERILFDLLLLLSLTNEYYKNNASYKLSVIKPIMELVDKIKNSQNIPISTPTPKPTKTSQANTVTKAPYKDCKATVLQKITIPELKHNLESFTNNFENDFNTINLEKRAFLMETLKKNKFSKDEIIILEYKYFQLESILLAKIFWEEFAKIIDQSQFNSNNTYKDFYMFLCDIKYLAELTNRLSFLLYYKPKNAIPFKNLANIDIALYNKNVCDIIKYVILKSNPQELKTYIKYFNFMYDAKSISIPKIIQYSDTYNKKNIFISEEYDAKKQGTDAQTKAIHDLWKKSLPESLFNLMDESNIPMSIKNVIITKLTYDTIGAGLHKNQLYKNIVLSNITSEDMKNKLIHLTERLETYKVPSIDFDNKHTITGMKELSNDEIHILHNTLIPLQKIISAKFFWDKLAASVDQKSVDSDGKYRNIYELLFTIKDFSDMTELKLLLNLYKPELSFPIINLTGMSTDTYNKIIITLLNKILHSNKKEIATYQKYLNIIKNEMAIGIGPIIKHNDWLTQKNIFQETKDAEENAINWWEKIDNNDTELTNKTVLSIIDLMHYKNNKNDKMHYKNNKNDKLTALKILINKFTDILSDIIYDMVTNIKHKMIGKKNQPKSKIR